MDICNSKISVAMTTFNGEKHVIKQLESIYHQTKWPDEVIICDDCSTDNTVKLIKTFISDHMLTNWSVFINEHNVGWKANFFKAVGLTTGDIVFFSDQDDIWNNDKIEVMSSLMIKHKMGALYANRIIIDPCDNILEGRQEKSSFSGSITKIAVSPSFYAIKTLGCCMCVNRTVVELYQKLGFNKDDHDSQCGRLALLCSSLWYLDKPVIRYRIHKGNSSGISPVASYGQSDYIKRINGIQLLIEWIGHVINTLPLTADGKSMLSECKYFLNKRLDFFMGKVSLVYLLFNLKYYTGYSMLLGDIAYKYKFNKFAGKILWILKR